MADTFDRFTARTLTIASIYPLECKLQRDYGFTRNGGMTEFLLPAAKKGSYSTLKISDMFQRIQDVDAMTASGRQSNKDFFVEVGSLAKDLHTHWAVQRIGTGNGFLPGIMVIAGDEPTEIELGTMNAQQKGYFEGLFLEGQAYAEKHDFKQINEIHRAAAVWLGVDAKWVANIGEQHKGWKECTACFEKINALATICKVCRSVQPDFNASPIAEQEAPRKAGRPPIAPPLKPVFA